MNNSAFAEVKLDSGLSEPLPYDDAWAEVASRYARMHAADRDHSRGGPADRDRSGDAGAARHERRSADPGHHAAAGHRAGSGARAVVPAQPTRSPSAAPGSGLSSRIPASL